VGGGAAPRRARPSPEQTGGEGKGKPASRAAMSRSARAPGGSDSRFFSTTKKGETHELRLELNSPNRDTKKDAVKKGTRSHRREGLAGIRCSDAPPHGAARFILLVLLSLLAPGL
jgi:hypothetical protein